MKSNSDPEGLKKQALLEDNCLVSAGGLVQAMEDLEKPSFQATAQPVKEPPSEEHAALKEYVKFLREW